MLNQKNIDKRKEYFLKVVAQYQTILLIFVLTRNKKKKFQ